MKTKRLVALLLTLGMTVSMLAGCGKAEDVDGKANETKVEEAAEEKTEEKEESQGISFPLEEPVTFTAAVCTNNEFTLEDSIIFQKMEEMTNVHWEFINIPVAEKNEKLNLLINSGDYPEIFIKCNTGSNEYDSGVFLPLEDMIHEYAPNYAALMDVRKGAWEKHTHTDGHIYGLGQINNDSYMMPDFWINTTWLENLGLEKPTSWDALYDVLKAFKEQDPNGNGEADEIPFLVCSYWDKIWNVANYMGLVRESHDANVLALNEAGDEIIYWPASEEGKELFGHLSKMYADGLIYNDAFVSTYEQTVALGKSAPIVGLQLCWGQGEWVGESTAGGYSDDFDFLEPFGDDKLPSRSGIETVAAFAISDACENPEVALAWIDYFYTEEGAHLALLGEEGVHYEILDDGSYKIAEEYIDDQSIGIHQGGGVSLPVYYTDMYNYKKYVDPDNITAVRWAEAVERVSKNYTSDVQFPSMTLTEEENETISSIYADCDAYWKQYAAQVITGEADLDATWDEYLNQMNRMGLKEMVEIFNAAANRK